MFRKLAIALAATVALGTVTLTASTTPAAAWGWKHHHHHHHGFWGGYRSYGPVYAGYAYGGCYAKRLVSTPWGLRWRWVNVCY